MSQDNLFHGAVARRLRKSRMLVSCSAGVASLMLGLAANANTAFAQAEAPAEAAVSNGDIVVTARRKDEALMDVPVSVTAFSQQALTQRAIANVFELNKAVPGLTVQANNGSTALPAFSIRGRGQNYGAASGSVEAYFAEVPLSPPFQEVTLPLQFFDLASFQVLKGPQGTLFGRNTTGGAVLVVPAAPSDKFEGYARGQFGNYANRQLEAAVNIPLLDDRIALRLAGFHWKRDGYLRTAGGGIDPVTGQVLPSQRFQNQNTSEFRATLRVRPTDGIENTTIFTYHYDKVRASLSPGLNTGDLLGGPLGTLVTVEPLSGFPVYQSPFFGTRTAGTSVNLERPGNHAWAVINTTSYDLSDDLKLKNILGYIEARGYTTAAQDADGTTEAINDIFLPARRNINRQFTNEVQLQGKSLDGRLDWTLGGLVDLTREPGGTRMNFQDYSSSFGTYATTFEQNRFTSYSLFAAGTFALTDTINLSAGYRHTWDDITLVSQVVSGGAPADGLVANSDPALASRASRKFEGDTYNVGLDWHPAPDTLVYGGYRRGYKRGGFNPTQAGSFSPETVDSFNLGFKQEFEVGGAKGRFSIEGFYDFYHDQQVSYVSLSPNGVFISVTTNIPKTVFRGFEAEGALDPAPWLNLSGAFSFVDAKNKRWMDNTALASGTQDMTVNPVPFVSKYKLSATARLHTELSDGGDEIAIAPSINYQSKFYTSPTAVTLPFATQNAFADAIKLPGFNFNQLAAGGATVPGYTTVDLRLEWNRVGGSALSLAGNVTNLTNKRYFLNVNGALYAGSGAYTIAPPRLFTIEARVAF